MAHIRKVRKNLCNYPSVVYIRPFCALLKIGQTLREQQTQARLRGIRAVWPEPLLFEHRLKTDHARPAQSL